MVDLPQKLSGSALAASVSAPAMLVSDTEVQAAFRQASIDAATVYLTAAQVRGRYGNASEMTLWRWLQDDKLKFPRPDRINGRRFWKAAELAAWERTRPAEPERQPPAKRKKPEASHR